MNVWRKFTLGLWVLVIAVCTAFFITYGALQTTVLNPTKAKSWLAQSNLYTMVRDDVLTDHVIGLIQARAAQTTLFDKPLIRSVLSDSLSKDEVAKKTEPAVDSVYRWLDSKEPEVAFEISLADKKEQFLRSLDVRLQDKISGLKTCESNPYPPEDALFTKQCVPSYVSSGEATQAVMGYIRASDVSIGETITQDSFDIPADTRSTLRNIPTYLNYLWVLNLLGIAVLLYTCVLLLWSRRFNGVIAIGAGIILGGAGALLIIPVLATGSTISTSGGFNQALGEVIRTLLPKFIAAQVKFGIYALSIGVALVVILLAARHLWKRRHG